VVRGSDSPPSAARCFCGRLISLSTSASSYISPSCCSAICTRLYSEPILIFRADPRLFRADPRSGRAILRGSRHTTPVSTPGFCARPRSAPGRQWASATVSLKDLIRRRDHCRSRGLLRGYAHCQSNSQLLDIGKITTPNNMNDHRGTLPGRTSPLVRSNLMRRSGHPWC
jgi:hypothetical protein